MKRNSSKAGEEPIGQLVAWGLLALCWFVMNLAASSRMYILATYEVGKIVDPSWEPFAATNLVVLFCFGVSVGWLLWSRWNFKAGCKSQSLATLYFAISLIPLVLWVLRVIEVVSWSAQFWEAIWIATWTGFSFGKLAHNQLERRPEAIESSTARPQWGFVAVLALISVLAGSWWFSQSVDYYRNFLLGYNDFGHFLQRVVNTAAGRGMLLETPVLPMFWDHFNPGILMLVPLWKLYPSVNLVFALQAGALAAGALLIYAISRRLEHSRLAAMVYGIAWLVQPSVGQMNLAYTYGWHPITFAIPLLLGAMLCLLSKQRFVALLCVLLALSMEEGVFVIVVLLAAACAALPSIEKYFNRNADAKSEGLIAALPTAAWAMVAVASVLGFVLVYKFSGLAEFQTGRFVALGSSPAEILLSPVIRPAAFWGQVLKLENVAFVLLLWLPCGLPALLRGWRYLLPTLLPLGVLIVWDHAPAHNLAFQYPSTLLPLFWIACLSSATMGKAGRDCRVAFPNAVTALFTGLILSLFVGQLPFSSATLYDVEAFTYGANLDNRRKSDGEDGRWLTQQIEKIRSDGGECLATTRIAAHLVGNRDIETVGQYLERREKLAALSNRNGLPIRHYQWVILDRNDSAILSGAATAEVEAEVLKNGFQLVTEQFNIAIYERRDGIE